MLYEYARTFCNSEHRNNLKNLSETASSNLKQILEDQIDLKKQIEDYEDSDWDQRYGATGLWRKLSTAINTTIITKCCIDFYLAISTGQPDKDNMLNNIVRKIDSTPQIQRSPGATLLKAGSLAALDKTSSDLKKKAIALFNELAAHDDINLAISAEIERIRLLSSAKNIRLNELIKKLEHN